MKHFSNMACCQAGLVLLCTVLFACLVNSEGVPEDNSRDVLDKMVDSKGIEDGPAGPPGSSGIEQRKDTSMKRMSDPNAYLRRYRCYDNNIQCVRWALAGECVGNPRYMHKFCQHACRTCCTNLNPNIQQCIIWAKAGECRANPDYMLTRCRYGCNGCDLRDTRRDVRNLKDTMSGAAPPGTRTLKDTMSGAAPPGTKPKPGLEIE